LQRHLEARRLQVLGRETKDLGVVGLASRRIRALSKDAPTGQFHYASALLGALIMIVSRPLASDSASRTSSGRSTSTTVSTTSPYIGSPARCTQPQYPHSPP